MMTVRPGSHLHQLLRLLSISGEFSTKHLGLLGNTRAIKKQIHKLESDKSFRLSDRTILTTAVFQITSQGRFKTLRLCKSAHPILNELHPNALRYYSATYKKNKVSGNRRTILRNHRIGEAVAMCMMAGIEAAPYALPVLQKMKILRIVPDTPSYYHVRSFKNLFFKEKAKEKDTEKAEDDKAKTCFTRIIGALFYPGGMYAVYNTREHMMKWCGLGEEKAKREMEIIARSNAGIKDVNSMLLLGTNAGAALKTVLESEEKGRIRHDRFDRIYENIHFIPMSQTGIDMIRILTLPDWKNKLLDALFAPEHRNRGHSSIDYDALEDGRVVFSYLDSNIARLIRFRRAVNIDNTNRKIEKKAPRQFDVICYPWQHDFVKDFLGGLVRLRWCEMSVMLEKLGLSRQCES
jgi:hypothetical protein